MDGINYINSPILSFSWHQSARWRQIGIFLIQETHISSVSCGEGLGLPFGNYQWKSCSEWEHLLEMDKVREFNRWYELENMTSCCWGKKNLLKWATVHSHGKVYPRVYECVWMCSIGQVTRGYLVAPPFVGDLSFWKSHALRIFQGNVWFWKVFLYIWKNKKKLLKQT